MSKLPRILSEIIAHKEAMNARKSFKSVLEKPGLSVIAEIKRKSPSKGVLAEISDPKKLAEKYILDGASAISVLTDEAFFGGSFKDLQVVSSCAVPVLCKDFILHKNQIIEAKLHQANAILLIVAVFEYDMLRFKRLYDFAQQLSLDVLVEVHTLEELEAVLEMGVDIIGINNRNLETFEVDINTALTLKAHIPEGVLTVAESGIASKDACDQLIVAGFDGVLIGEAFVKVGGAHFSGDANEPN